METFLTQELVRLSRPCVYAFISGGRALYIGSSVHGINRFGSVEHHYRNVMEFGEHVRVFWCRSESNARFVEERLIRTLHPPFNNERLKQGPHPQWTWEPELQEFITEQLALPPRKRADFDASLSIRC